jgi:cell division protein FtsB
MRWLLLILLVLLVTLQYQLWFRGGMNDVWELEKSLAVQRAENAKLHERNQSLAAEVEDLKTARSKTAAKLGMVKQGGLIQVARPRARRRQA